MTVKAFKYGGRLHREWQGVLRGHFGTLIILDAVFERDIEHPLLGIICKGTLSTEYYWEDRWYSVFRFRHPTLAPSRYYGNINTPVKLAKAQLTYVDLDLDLWVGPDLEYQVLDREDFVRNSSCLKYPKDICRSAEQGLKDLIQVIKERNFPFDHEFER